MMRGKACNLVLILAILCGKTCTTNQDYKTACPENCVTSEINTKIICDEKTLDCLFGCKDGFYGNQCNMGCSEGCLYKTCFRNGSCDQGCVAGSYGDVCHLSCNKNCWNETCTRETGFCSGCSSGLYGNMCSLHCNKTCENGTCEQNSGVCRLTIPEHCESGVSGWFGQNNFYINVAILGSGWASFLIFYNLVIVIACIRCCSRCKGTLKTVSVSIEMKSETTKSEKEIVRMNRSNQGDEYITLHIDSCEVKNSFDSFEYADLKVDKGEARNKRQDVVSYVNLGLKRFF